MSIASRFIDSVSTIISWISMGLRQSIDAYCDIQTADSPTTLAMYDGTLVSILEIKGVTHLIGEEEFTYIHDQLLQSLRPTMSPSGYSIQLHYSYNKDNTEKLIASNFTDALETAAHLQMDVKDIIDERVEYISQYCSEEILHMVLITKPSSLSPEALKTANKAKVENIKAEKIPPFRLTQNIIAALPPIRDAHDSFVRSVLTDLNELHIATKLLDVHTAINHIRSTIDLEFTDPSWTPVLPGDKIRPKILKNSQGDIADILWPNLVGQLFPRDASNIDMKICAIGDRIFSSVFIDLFPRNIQSFQVLLNRTLQTKIPWRISFLLDSNGLNTLSFKKAMSGILSFSSQQNRLINDSIKLLEYIQLNTDDTCVRLRVAACTWANAGEERLLQNRVAQLARAIESWGSCDVSQVSGDPFEGVVSSMLGVSMESSATPTVASLSDTITMLPFYRPSSPWNTGSVLFRTPDGKPWPYQPGSPQQTTWIDIIYARPGSGKSVLSNAINFALCLQNGLQRLPRISVIDIGPSSAGLISLIQEALPKEQRYLAAYYKLEMLPEYSINPFDTHLGCRTPFPQERAFLVNFVTLLVTPIGSESSYDGISDMVGMVIDEAYKSLSDTINPNAYTRQLDPMIDGMLDKINFQYDEKTTYWEITDALFAAGYTREASIAQRSAVPLLADLTTIARSPAVIDLYGKITVSTGESLIDCFVRMISSSVREYPILSRYTRFDIGNARVVSLDLNDVAKSGGDAADRQTAVMYMLARYVLAKDFYLNTEVLQDLPPHYRDYHTQIALEIRDDPKRLVMDEFHRTSKSQSVRDQVIVDMREGRKWKVQIALISQSLDDFTDNMIEFATSVFIMDAGPELAIQKTTKVFGLSNSAQNALRQYVHGPREGGATFLALIATKAGSAPQLLTATFGPIELWALSTTTDDVSIRDHLYTVLGPKEGRRVLANIFPSGSASGTIEKQTNIQRQKGTIISDENRKSIVKNIINTILAAYQQNPNTTRIILS